MDAELESVASRVQDVSRPRVAFVGGDPPTVAGPGTFLHELVELAGGEDAFSDLRELYAPISLEELFRRDVERILAPESTRLPAALGSTPVSRVPITVITPGLQVGESARQLATLLHPDRFP
jgi:iron complex transport system substrate-binding protein